MKNIAKLGSIGILIALAGCSGKSQNAAPSSAPPVGRPLLRTRPTSASVERSRAARNAAYCGIRTDSPGARNLWMTIWAEPLS